MSNAVQPAMLETSAEICNGNSRIKYNFQYKGGSAYLSLNEIDDEATTLCQQSRARNASLKSQPNPFPTSLISETTKELVGRADGRHHRSEEAAQASLGAMAFDYQDIQPWKGQPVLDGPQQFALDNPHYMKGYHSLGDGTPEAPVTSDQRRKRTRGRPPGSKNKPKPDPSAILPEKRKRGRPIGARNKPKLTGATPAETTGAHPTPSVHMPPENNIEQDKTFYHNGSTSDDNEHIYHQYLDFTSTVSSQTSAPISVQEPSLDGWTPMEPTIAAPGSLAHHLSIHDSSIQQHSLDGWTPIGPTNVVNNSSSMLWSPEKHASHGQGLMNVDETFPPAFKATYWGSQQSDEDLQTPSARNTLDIDAEFTAMNGVMPENMTTVPDLEFTTSSGSISPTKGELSTPPDHEMGHLDGAITGQFLEWLDSEGDRIFAYSDDNYPG
ncbi:MAG: hypothetical protein Q9195_001232 [Heterodermia aff. obscurata]